MKNSLIPHRSHWPTRTDIGLAISTVCVIPLILLAYSWLAGTSVFASPLAQDAQSEPGIYDDEFNNSQLNPRWTWMNEDRDAWAVSLLRGRLIIDGTAGDFAFRCNNAQNVLLQGIPTGSFEIVTKVDIDLNDDFQQAGIVLMNSQGGESDPDNYVKVGILHSSFDGGKLAGFFAEQAGSIDLGGWNVREIESSQPAYVKVVHSESTISGYYSADGDTWTQIGAYDFELSEDAQMGLYAVSGIVAFGDEPTCAPDVASTSAEFDYFRVSTDTEVADVQVDADDDPPVVRTLISVDEADDPTAEAEVSSYITQRLNAITYEYACAYAGRSPVNNVQIGDTSYVGAYDIWTNCEENATATSNTKGVLLITPDSDALLYLLLVVDMDAGDDLAAFEDALSEQLSQRVVFAGPEERLAEDADIAETNVNQDDTDEANDAIDTSEAAETSVQRLGDLARRSEDGDAESVTRAARPNARSSVRNAAAVQADGPNVIVKATLLNLRSGPGVNFEKIGTVANDTSLTVIGQAGNCAWLQVVSDVGENVWVSGNSQFANFTGNCDDVPEVNQP